MKLYYVILFTVLSSVCIVTDAFAQPSNDDCQGAIQITNLDNWCSNSGAFSNTGATDGTADGTPYDAATCFTNLSNDVWFVFNSVAKDVIITINGESNSNGGTLIGPEVALYSGNCGGVISELECQADNAADFVELYQGGLIIGATYYIRVEGVGNMTGSFQLCINNFNPPIDPTSDCSDASILCDKSTFTIQALVGAGNDDTEFSDAPCFSNGVGGLGEEFNSVWFKWTCEDAGSLTFDLIPTRPDADLDFVLYELPGGLDDCAGKQLIRCMAAGESPALFPSPCHGPTGLSSAATDDSENAGCDQGQDNYVAAVGMVSGRSYALGINNFGPGTEGFSIEFGGTGTFVGPVPDFTFSVDSVMCLDPVTIFDISTFALGNIVSWEWSFGQDAMPPTANTPGPHEIIYGSVGIKSVALTVESDEGCIVTNILPFEVVACCGDPIPDDLGISIINQVDPVCAGDSTGLVTIGGIDGTPFYQFSDDGFNYQGGQTYSNLPAGNYTFYVRDKLGCEEAIDVIINEPPPLVVDAGPDQEVDLGFEADLNANYTPVSPTNIITWDPDSLISCMNCLDPTVLPAGTTTYTLTVTDPAGCAASDEITIFVSDERPIFIPNAFSPNFDGLNDIFTIYASPAVDVIKVFRVYDRWGELIYEGENLTGQDATVGWDGTFRGEKMQPGVYVYYADVRFVDNVDIIYEGDITLVW